jgi:SAM-dependent methyltransferase
VRLNKPCEIEDFENVDAAAMIRAIEPELTELYPDYPRGREHRKSWEYQQVVRGALLLGALNPEGQALCLGASRDRIAYELTKRFRRVFAAGHYGDVDSGTCDPYLLDPGVFASQPYDARRLLACHMDTRYLRFEDEAFDFAVCPNFSAFGAPDDVLLEVERVLKPGAIAALVVEFAVDTQGGFRVGTTQVYDSRLLQNRAAANLELVQEIQETASERTLVTAIPLREARDEAERGVSRFPHIVMESGGRRFTSATVFLRKETEPIRN